MRQSSYTNNFPAIQGYKISIFPLWDILKTNKGKKIVFSQIKQIRQLKNCDQIQEMNINGKSCNIYATRIEYPTLLNILRYHSKRLVVLSRKLYAFTF